MSEYRKIDDGAYLDNAGQLWIEEEGQVDLWAPPGSPAPVVKRATGFTYLDVPTYGLLGVFWKNNPLQFASEATAREMTKVIEVIVPSVTVWPGKQEVRVGPFSWRDLWLLTVENGRDVATINAGEAAARLARHPQNFATNIREQIEREFSKKPAGWE